MSSGISSDEVVPVWGPQSLTVIWVLWLLQQFTNKSLILVLYSMIPNKLEMMDFMSSEPSLEDNLPV